MKGNSRAVTHVLAFHRGAKPLNLRRLLVALGRQLALPRGARALPLVPLARVGLRILCVHGLGFRGCAAYAGPLVIAVNGSSHHVSARLTEAGHARKGARPLAVVV